MIPQKEKLTEIELEELLRKWAKAYYNEQPLVSDQIFDEFQDYFKLTYPENQLLKEIGAPVPRDTPWDKVEHTIPMTSLDKINTEEQFEKWANSLKYKSSTTQLTKTVDEFWLSEKLDGFSIELVYNQGSLIQAITRGDGLIGEDITENIRLSKSLPQKLTANFNGAIRGEVIFRKSQFNTLQLTREGGEFYSNPRNAAAGIARRFDHQQAEYLEILCYDIISYDNHSFPSEEVKNLTMQKLGLPVLGGQKVSIEKAKSVFENYLIEKRAELDYEIDGLVLKVNDLQAVNQLEDSARENKNPKTQRAWKFTAEGKVSILRDIIFSLGKSGTITPIAKVDPVKIAGATIELASLHNISIMEKLGVAIGDSVYVIRANDVIPQVIRVETKRNFNPVELPKKCEACGTNLVLQKTKKNKKEVKILLCPNEIDCPTQKIGKISRFIEQLDIKDFNESRIEALYNANLISDTEDLFTFDHEEAALLDGLGERTIEKFVKQLKSLTNIPLEKVLGGLGINSLSSRQWKKLTNEGYKQWSDIDHLLILSEKQFIEELSKIKGLGKELTKIMYWGLQNRQKTYQALKKHITIAKQITGPLTGFKFCMTGIRSYQDKDISLIIENNGGEIKGSVSKNLDYLIVSNYNVESTKSKKAKSLSINLITMEDLLTRFKIKVV